MSDEQQFYPLPRIGTEDFAEFAEILIADEDFPNTFAGWKRWTEVRRVELAVDGFAPKFIDVLPADFRRFMEESGGKPSMNTLAAYVAVLATNKQ